MLSDGVHRLGLARSVPKRPSITVVGCGGAGCNMVTRASESGLSLGNYVAANTDAQHLLSIRAHRKLLLGRECTRGRGTNMDVTLGEKACREALHQLEFEMMEADIVVILSGLGGGTGSGAAPVVARAARDCGCLAISLATLPFSVEGSTRRANAAVGEASLSLHADMSMVLPNDHMLESSPSVSLVEAFRKADDRLLHPVDLLRRLITKEDMPKLKEVLGGSGGAHLGSGASNRKRGYSRALLDAVERLYPPATVGECDRALVMFEAGMAEPGDGELEEIARSLHLAMAGEAITLWGVSRKRRMGEFLNVVLVLSGGPKR